MPIEDKEGDEERCARTPYDLIRIRLNRLEKNIDRPAPIPTKKDDIRAPRPPPEFVRNVVGSSAAAGSAEFHIYRNNRRKEQNRLDYIEQMAKREEMDTEFRTRKEEIERDELEKTARRRAKRQRQKERIKQKRAAKKKKKDDESSDEDSEPSDDDSGSASESNDGSKKDGSEAPEDSREKSGTPENPQ